MVNSFSEPIHDPLLKTFPYAVNDPDLMDVFRKAWLEKIKQASRDDKRNFDTMKEFFTKSFMQNIYPLYHSASLSEFDLVDTEIRFQRQEQIARLSEISNGKNFVASLLSAKTIHKPMDLSEVSFHIIGVS